LNSLRQRGRGFGAVALGLGRTLIPFAARGFKYVLPAVKKLGREFIKEAAPELIDSVLQKRKPKLRKAVGNTLKKQIGRGKKRKIIRSKTGTRTGRLKRNRSSFFSRVQNVG
jgi:hypothetical protein